MIRAMEKLNPLMKAAGIIAAGLILGFSFSPVVNVITAAVCLVLLLVFSKCNKITFLKLMIPITIAVVSLFMTGYMNANGNVDDTKTVSKVSLAAFDAVAHSGGGSIYTALSLSTRMLAFAFLGLLFALTTDGEEFVLSLMHQGHLKPKFAYGVLAALNLMPEIRDEYSSARLAYKVKRKSRPLSLKPLFAAMVNCVRWSETLSMAMESKGFDGDGTRTFAKRMKVCRWDIVFAVALNAMIVLGLVFL